MVWLSLPLSNSNCSSWHLDIALGHVVQPQSPPVVPSVHWTWCGQARSYWAKTKPRGPCGAQRQDCLMAQLRWGPFLLQWRVTTVHWPPLFLNGKSAKQSRLWRELITNPDWAHQGRGGSKAEEPADQSGSAPEILCGETSSRCFLRTEKWNYFYFTQYIKFFFKLVRTSWTCIPNLVSFTSESTAFLGVIEFSFVSLMSFIRAENTIL